MPRFTRAFARAQAGLVKTLGESVTLLSAIPGQPTEDVPFSATDSDKAPSITGATVLATVYARVHWVNEGKIDYTVGGKLVNREITVEVPIGLQQVMASCLYIKLSSGAYFVKTAESLSDDRLSYTVRATSYLDPSPGG